jgi:hypothetical protein
VSFLTSLNRRETLVAAETKIKPQLKMFLNVQCQKVAVLTETFASYGKILIYSFGK